MRWRAAALAFVLSGLSAGVRASEASDLALLEAFVAEVRAAPPLALPRSAAAEALQAPLAKSATRADGVAFAVFAGGLAESGSRAVQQGFASHADRFLARLLLRLPRRSPPSPQAPGLVEHRLVAPGDPAVMFLLAWHRDDPFPGALQAAAGSSECEQRIPPWDAGPVPRDALPGQRRKQTWWRVVGSLRHERQAEWELVAGRGGLAWRALDGYCRSTLAAQPRPRSATAR